mgnify:FL=1
MSASKLLGWIAVLLPWLSAERTARQFLPASKLLGWIAVLLLLLAVASGFLLACFYVPTHDQAYVSVRELAFARPYALWARGMHRIAAHLAILFALPHFAFLLWKDRSRDARRLAWATGLLAFALLGLLAFLGRVLPWDVHGAVSLSIALSFFGFAPVASEAPQPAVLPAVWFLHLLSAATLVACVASHLPWRAVVRGGSFARERLPLLTLSVLPVAAAAAFALRPSLGLPFDGFTPSTSSAAEWYLRWLQFLAERSLTLARIVTAALVALAVALPWAATPPMRMRLRYVWVAVLAVLLLLSAMPIGAGAASPQVGP